MTHMACEEEVSTENTFPCGGYIHFLLTAYMLPRDEGEENMAHAVLCEKCSH